MRDIDPDARKSDEEAAPEQRKKMTRREFLPETILGVGLLAAGGVYLYTRSGKGAPERVDESAPNTRQARQAVGDVDPKLIEYEQVGRIDTGFAEPRQIAVAGDGNLHVAGDQAVRTFDLSGTQIAEMPLRGSPHCIAVDDSGEMYVGFRNHVEVYGDGSRSPVRWPSFGERAYLTSLALSGDDVWVADAGGRIVLQCDRSGRVRGRIGAKDESRGIPGLVLPSPHLDVVAAPDGRLLVNNCGRWSVEAYTAAGELESSWGYASQGIEGFSGCCNPTDIALFPDGRVATSEKGLARVKVYSPDGALECVVAAPSDFSVDAISPNDCSGRGLDIAIDSEERVLVLEPGASTVWVFARRDSDRAEEVIS